MEITILGSGTPTPSLTRMSSGYRLRMGGETVILDCGPGVYHRMMEAGTAAEEVTTVLLSHLHYDHCLDYQRLVLTHWDQSAGKLPELKVFGPAPIARITEQLFGAGGVWDPDLTARTQHPMSEDVHTQRGGSLPRPRPAPEVSEIQSGKAIEAEGWSATPFEVRHAQPFIDCFGYRIESETGTLVYFGDTGPFEGLENHAADADVLISMCHYFSGTAPSDAFEKACMGHRELAEIAARAGVRNLVISHITSQLDRPGLRERVISEMALTFAGNIFFGADLMDVPIGDPIRPRLD